MKGATSPSADINLSSECIKTFQMSCSQTFSVWRPLRGPVRDWPLTLCDPATIDPNTDLVARDLLRVTSPVETYQVHSTAQQKWYFVSEQTKDEAWIFLQSDSDVSGLTGKGSSPSLNTKLRLKAQASLIHHFLITRQKALVLLVKVLKSGR